MSEAVESLSTSGPRLWRWAAAPSGWATIAGALLVAGLCVPGLMLATPGAYFGAMPHDSLSMADIGYRLAAGQVPGRDFHSAFGAMFQLQMALAYGLGPTVSQCLEFATALFFLGAAPLIAYLARTRLSNLGATALVFAVVVLGCAPYANAGQNLIGATFAMLYNREGWALLLILALFWLPPVRPTRAWLEGPIIGLLTAAALYTKISYGGVALLFCALLAVSRPATRVALALGALTAALIALALELAFGFGFNLAYLADILTVARAGGARISHILLNLFTARYELAIAGLLVPLLIWRDRRPAAAEVGFVLFTALASLLIVWQNAQVEGLVLLWAGLAAMLEPSLALAGSSRSAKTGARVALVGAIYLSWALLTLTPSLLATVQYAAGALLTPPQAPNIGPIADVRFQSPHKARYVRTDGAAYGDEYAAALQDGVTLLDACPKSGRVFTVDLFEPFTLLTHRPPNSAWTWHDPGHSFTRTFHPAAKDEFAGVDCVMIPRLPTKPASTDELLAAYGTDLNASFPVVRTSRDWTLRLRGESGR